MGTSNAASTEPPAGTAAGAILPSAKESWPPTEGQFFVGPAADDFEVSAVEAKRYLAGKPWVWPTAPHLFFCDVHADAEAFLRSLVASGGVERTGPGDGDFELTARGRESVFVIGGDCFDKGPRNLRLLRAIKKLLDTGAQVELLAGNHDLRTLLGISYIGNKEPRYAHLFVRMGRKSIRLFKEVYDEYLAGTGAGDGVDEAEVKDLLFPGEDWYEKFPEVAQGLIPPKKLEKELVRIREKERELSQRVAKTGMTLGQVYAAVEKCRELFTRPAGEFSWFFREMKLAYRGGSFLFVHAGIDDSTAAVLRAEGVEGLNRRYEAELDSDLFTLYHGPLGNTFRTKYRDIDFQLTDTGVEDVHRAGVYAIVHGHRSLLRGQRLMFRRGMLNFECDCSVDRNTRHLSELRGLGAAVTMFEPDCKVLGVSADHPKVKVFDPASINRAVAIVRPAPRSIPPRRAKRPTFHQVGAG